MKEEKIRQLAEKIQLTIDNEDLPLYLKTFKKLEKLLKDFQKVNLEKNKSMSRIDVGHLTLSNLKKMTRNFVPQKVSKKILKKNAKTTSERFILFNP